MTARVTRAVDGLVDAAVLAFAAWTVIYHVCLLLQPPTWVMLACWAVVSAAGITAWFRRGTGAALWHDRAPRGRPPGPRGRGGRGGRRGGNERGPARGGRPVVVRVAARRSASR
ncbi:hypothetical protein BJF79_31500 [Actinomadura sp. CNU-125]|uniref:hypothetical protein n=1 Tax=Actinomadura sp. CNU-125 TaxID=1904961 RepID=UPI00095FCCD4|nr:hypothetical protein [Actinomadura sp. CNU-125]OLT36118.1 hypothetical protein BJF79_31500 [Actinomadura sp. CNU-125]